MKTYLISLKSAVERRAFQCEQLTALGLDFTIFDALVPNQLTELNTDLKRDNWERPLMPTELACFLSHYAVWQLVSNSVENALILEDDVILSKNTPAFLKVAQNIAGIDHLTLETRLRKKLISTPVNVAPGFGISRLIQDRSGAAAYLISPAGAKKLISSAFVNGVALADAFIANNHDIRSFQAIPALAIQSDISAEYGITSNLKTISYIQLNDKRNNHTQNGFRKIKFKRRRLAAQTKLAWRFFTHILTAKRKFVSVDTNGFY
tara:strand:+ start:57 stop:848 length:792 start_codon:yes stop_codon:yes gene_type:complete